MGNTTRILSKEYFVPKPTSLSLSKTIRTTESSPSSPSYWWLALPQCSSVWSTFISSLPWTTGFFLQISKLVTEDDAFRKFYSIRKLRMNLIDIKIQFIYPNFVIYRVFIGQGLNVFFQLYYNELGPENIFNIWWTSFFLENIGKILYKSVQLSP